MFLWFKEICFGFEETYFWMEEIDILRVEDICLGFEEKAVLILRESQYEVWREANRIVGLV